MPLSPYWSGQDSLWKTPGNHSRLRWRPRAGNLFTTHTPVAAGFDRFSPGLMEQYLGRYASDRLHIPLRNLLAFGRGNPDDGSEFFNMAYLAIRGSGAVTGVSRLHGTVSRQIFLPLFPRWPQEEIPVGYVTNGVHTPSWDSAEADELWTKAAGKDRWLGEQAGLERDIRKVSDGDLWKCRATARRSLVEYVRQRHFLEMSRSGAPPEAIEHTKRVFDPNALTLGFARRFASYKRPTLLLHDQEHSFVFCLIHIDRFNLSLPAKRIRPIAMVKRWCGIGHILPDGRRSSRIWYS